MAISNGYASLAEYKAYIAMRGLSGSVGTDTSDDSVIEDFIEAVSRYVDRQTGRRFYVDGSDTVYYYQAESSVLVILPDFASITTVSADFNNTRTYTDYAATAWEALPDNYSDESLPINGLALSPVSTSYFPTHRRGIKITGKRGWAAVPDDIKEATLSIAQNLYSARSGQSTEGRVRVTASGVVIQPNDIPEFAQRIIQSYRYLS